MRRDTAKVILIGLLIAVGAFVVLVKPGSLVRPVQAKPAYMDRYNRDSYAKRELMDKCTVCHVGRGGERRNDFGEAFEDAGYRVTPKLRAKFPTLFNPKKADSNSDEPQNEEETLRR